MVFECGFLEPRKAPTTSWIGSVRCGKKGSQLPDGYRPFKNTSEIWLAFDANCREQLWLTEQVRVVAQGEPSETARSFKAEHASADAPEREGNVVKVLASINLVESTLLWDRFDGEFSSLLITVFAD